MVVRSRWRPWPRHWLGFNRFRILTALFSELRADIGDALHRPWRQRLKTVLRFEALVLLLVLVAAAVLAGT